MRQTINDIPEEGKVTLPKKSKKDPATKSNVTPPKKSKKDQKEPAKESKVAPPKKCKKDTKDKKRLSEEPPCHGVQRQGSECGPFMMILQYRYSGSSSSTLIAFA